MRTVSEVSVDAGVARRASEGIVFREWDVLLGLPIDVGLGQAVVDDVHDRALFPDT